MSGADLRASLILLLYAAIVAGFAVLLVEILGCAHPTKAPQPPKNVPGISDCTDSVPTAVEACPGMFTAGGLACIQCSGAGGCFDVDDVVYCTLGGSCSDPACSFHDGGQ